MIIKKVTTIVWMVALNVFGFVCFEAGSFGFLFLIGLLSVFFGKSPGDKYWRFILPLSVAIATAIAYYFICPIKFGHEMKIFGWILIAACFIAGVAVGWFSLIISGRKDIQQITKESPS